MLSCIYLLLFRTPTLACVHFIHACTLVRELSSGELERFFVYRFMCVYVSMRVIISRDVYPYIRVSTQGGVITDEDDLVPYNTDWMKKYQVCIICAPAQAHTGTHARTRSVLLARSFVLSIARCLALALVHKYDVHACTRTQLATHTNSLSGRRDE